MQTAMTILLSFFLFFQIADLIDGKVFTNGFEGCSLNGWVQSSTYSALSTDQAHGGSCSVFHDPPGGFFTFVEFEFQANAGDSIAASVWVRRALNTGHIQFQNPDASVLRQVNITTGTPADTWTQFDINDVAEQTGTHIFYLRTNPNGEIYWDDTYLAVLDDYPRRPALKRNY